MISTTYRSRFYTHSASVCSRPQAAKVIDELCALPVVSTDPELVRRAIETSRRFSIALWDALIIEAARAGGCRRVSSEDPQSGQDFEGVVVENPFER